MSSGSSANNLNWNEWRDIPDRGNPSAMIFQALLTGGTRAVCATKVALLGFQPVPHDHGSALTATRRDFIDGALETIKPIRRPVHFHFERMLVDVPAIVASSFGAGIHISLNCIFDAMGERSISLV